MLSQNEYLNKILRGDALSILKQLPDESVSCVVTSPPYWALRDYGSETEVIWDGKEDCEHKFEQDFCSKCGAWKGQLGLEPDFNLYIKHLCDIFDEVKRALKKDGTCWVNMGDTYYTKSGSSFENDNLNPKSKEEIEKTTGINKANKIRGKGLLQSKNLTLIPFRFAIEMQNRGWILRNVIIWHKPNSMPSSVKDRFTIDFEYIFFFVKNKKYWFEQQFEPLKEISIKIAEYGWYGKKLLDGKSYNGVSHIEKRGERFAPVQGRNKRCVWTISTKSFKGAHFATFPPDLIEPMILAGCPKFVCKKCGKPKERIIQVIPNPERSQEGRTHSLEEQRQGKTPTPEKGWQTEKQFIGWTDCGCGVGFEPGIVLDPFMGSGTTALVSLKLKRNFVGIELNSEYIKMAYERIKPYLSNS